MDIGTPSLSGSGHAPYLSMHAAGLCSTARKRWPVHRRWALKAASLWEGWTPGRCSLKEHYASWIFTPQPKLRRTTATMLKNSADCPTPSDLCQGAQSSHSHQFHLPQRSTAALRNHTHLAQLLLITPPTLFPLHFLTNFQPQALQCFGPAHLGTRTHLQELSARCNPWTSLQRLPRATPQQRIPLTVKITLRISRFSKSPEQLGHPGLDHHCQAEPFESRLEVWW